MDLERNQRQHDQFLANKANVASSNDVELIKNEVTEQLIKGAEVMAAGRELGLSEDETLIALQRKVEREQKMEQRRIQQRAERQRREAIQGIDTVDGQLRALGIDPAQVKALGIDPKAVLLGENFDNDQVFPANEQAGLAREQGLRDVSRRQRLKDEGIDDIGGEQALFQDFGGQGQQAAGRPRFADRDKGIAAEMNRRDEQRFFDAMAEKQGAQKDRGEKTPWAERKRQQNERFVRQQLPDAALIELQQRKLDRGQITEEQFNRNVSEIKARFAEQIGERRPTVDEFIDGKIARGEISEDAGAKMRYAMKNAQPPIVDPVGEQWQFEDFGLRPFEEQGIRANNDPADRVGMEGFEKLQARNDRGFRARNGWMFEDVDKSPLEMQRPPQVVGPEFLNAGPVNRPLAPGEDPGPQRAGRQGLDPFQINAAGPDDRIEVQAQRRREARRGERGKVVLERLDKRGNPRRDNNQPFKQGNANESRLLADLKGRLDKALAEGRITESQYAQQLGSLENRLDPRIQLQNQRAEVENLRRGADRRADGIYNEQEIDRIIQRVRANNFIEPVKANNDFQNQQIQIELIERNNPELAQRLRERADVFERKGADITVRPETITGFGGKGQGLLPERRELTPSAEEAMRQELRARAKGGPERRARRQGYNEVKAQLDEERVRDAAFKPEPIVKDIRGIRQEPPIFGRPELQTVNPGQGLRNQAAMPVIGYDDRNETIDALERFAPFQNTEVFEADDLGLARNTDGSIDLAQVPRDRVRERGAIWVGQNMMDQWDQNKKDIPPVEINRVLNVLNQKFVEQGVEVGSGIKSVSDLEVAAGQVLAKKQRAGQAIFRFDKKQNKQVPMDPMQGDIGDALAVMGLKTPNDRKAVARALFQVELAQEDFRKPQIAAELPYGAGRAQNAINPGVVMDAAEQMGDDRGVMLASLGRARMGRGKNQPELKGQFAQLNPQRRQREQVVQMVQEQEAQLGRRLEQVEVDEIKGFVAAVNEDAASGRELAQAQQNMAGVTRGQDPGKKGLLREDFQGMSPQAIYDWYAQRGRNEEGEAKAAIAESLIADQGREASRVAARDQQLADAQVGMNFRAPDTRQPSFNNDLAELEEREQIRRNAALPDNRRPGGVPIRFAPQEVVGRPIVHPNANRHEGARVIAGKPGPAITQQNLTQLPQVQQQAALASNRVDSDNATPRFDNSADYARYRGSQPSMRSGMEGLQLAQDRALAEMPAPKKQAKPAAQDPISRETQSRAKAKRQQASNDIRSTQAPKQSQQKQAPQEDAGQRLRRMMGNRRVQTGAAIGGAALAGLGVGSLIKGERERREEEQPVGYRN